MKNALITGATGQDGTYLTELLLEKDYRVFAMLDPTRGDDDPWAEVGDVEPVRADMRDQESLARVVDDAAPDEVYNFAGLSSVGSSWGEPELVADVNGLGVVRLIEAVREHAPSARLVQASTAAIFGDPDRSPQDEATPIAPTSPYGIAKAFAHLAVQNARLLGMHASNAILYNHESPRRPTTFVTPKIAEGAARVKLGLADELRLGNLDVVRDWGFAGDYVEAMWRMTQAEEPGDYVIATGQGHTVRDFAEASFAYLGLDYRDHVVVDEELLRPSDTEALVGDSGKACDRLGWKAGVGFDGLVKMMVDAAVARLQTR